MNRYSYENLQRLERCVLASECYTSNKSFRAQTFEARKEYIHWLEKQTTVGG